ncbi:carbohydrate-binding module family 13 protein [Rhizophagus clarus]|uniref:Carbohydrate-binding module family 13 protein n=1 Tax=Rhizophagus clarus TaxID=94130 RepID=A0A8H3MD42_9GLOM|nr:carbohydrate-binding module family 13 protein [Rhizophagus clarus]
MEDNKLLSLLSRNLLEILEDDEFYDITIEVGDDPYNNDGILAHIKLPNILPKIFQIILRYIYGGRLSLEKYVNSDIIKILVTASEFEFVEKVYPYKKIIPKELREKLIKDFIYQPNKITEQKITKEISSKSIDSKIITYQHTELISKWISRLGITNKIKNPYEFKLILRGSRDGFSSSKFHEICDNQSHTISIIKVKNSDEILGGYNPDIWKSDNSWGATKDSFIFSFKDKENIENNILSRVTKKEYAMFNSPNRGPSFATNLVLYGNDSYDRSYCEKDFLYYDKPIRETEDYFSVKEYEIFQITKD